MNRLRGMMTPGACGFIIKWIFPGGERQEQYPPIRVESEQRIEILSSYTRGAAVIKLDSDATVYSDYYTVSLNIVSPSQKQSS